MLSSLLKPDLDNFMAVYEYLLDFSGQQLEKELLISHWGFC